MKILIIGFLAFSGWSAFSSYFYVCKIKGLCDDPIAVQIDRDIIAGDTIVKPVIREQLESPKDMNIYFAFDKSELNTDADAKAEKYFEESKNYLNQDLQKRISITGHTDAVGSDTYNQALGYRRAQSILHYFESKGMPANRIVIESKGEKEPSDDNTTTAGRANNRRTAITIKN
jgi:outer membrane protein OmpA-like peptidoglycan-associated protein